MIPRDHFAAPSVTGPSVDPCLPDDALPRHGLAIRDSILYQDARQLGRALVILDCRDLTKRVSAEYVRVHYRPVTR